MDFRVLGTLEVRDEAGQPCAFGRRKERQLLAILLLSSKRAVPSGRLIDWLWDGCPPSSAGSNLQSYVSQLRRQLGRGGARLETHAGGYLLHVEPGELDAVVFEDLVAQGGRAASDGEHALAVERLTRALGLWRAETVAEGLPLPAEVQAEAARLEELRTAAVEELFEARLAMGQHRELVPELEVAIRKHPLREGLWAARMLALYRSGRQAEALAAYQDVREVLAAELGCDPGPELRRVQQQILAADPELMAVPAQQASAPRPAQLPADLASFTGRGDELTGLLELAAGDHQAVVISAIDGMAGIGKTALAVHAAHRLTADYLDGQIFVDLHGFTEGLPPLEPAEALDQLLLSLGVPGAQIPHTVDERSALWRTRLADRRMLVLLDNAATEQQVRPLLPGAAACLVLVTSRRRLTGLDDIHPISLDVLPEADAITLFTRIVGSDRVAGEPAELIAEIVELCGRLPLAIRIAAARLRSRETWTPAHLADRLRDEQLRLTELEVGERSVAAAIELSYAVLNPDQQRMFRMLGLHPGPDIEPYAAAALADVDIAKAERLLDDLLDTHLLQQQHPGRFRFHDLIRAHAGRVCAEQASERERHAAFTRLYDYYAEAASVACGGAYPHDKHLERWNAQLAVTLPGLDDGQQALTWFGTELTNLVAVAVHAGQHGSAAVIVHLAVPLQRYLLDIARYGDIEVLHKTALGAARSIGDHRGEHRTLAGLGIAQSVQGRYGPAVEYFEQALNVARDIGDRDGEREPLYGLGNVDLFEGRLDAAAKRMNEVVLVAREVGARGGELIALNTLGTIHLLQDRPDMVFDCCGAAVRIAREIGHRSGEAFALGNLGEAYSSRGQYELATEALIRAVDITTTANLVSMKLNVLNGLGSVYRSQGKYELASEVFEQAVELAESLGFSVGKLAAQSGLATLRYLQGDFETAAEYFDQVMKLATTTGVRNYQFEASLGIGFTSRAAGSPSDALAMHRQALDLAHELGSPSYQARALHGLAEAKADLGQVEEARRHWRQALAKLEEIGRDRVEEVSADEIRLRLAEIGQDA